MTSTPGAPYSMFLDDDHVRAPIPEPASITLIGLGLAGFGVARARRKRIASQLVAEFTLSRWSQGVRQMLGFSWDTVCPCRTRPAYRWGAVCRVAILCELSYCARL